MGEKSPTPRLPLRLVFSGAGAAVLLAATVLLGLYLGNQTQERFNAVAESWSLYSGEVDRRGELLSRIRGHLGYGGIIHNFKNFVLRQDQKYLDALHRQLTDLAVALEDYRRSGASPRELEHLASIESTIAKYESMIPIAVQGAAEAWPPARTDTLVKVDDSDALRGLDALDAYWRGKRRETTKAIVSVVGEGKNLVDQGFQFLGGLALVALVLYGLFYLLQRELRQTIGLLSGELAERRAAEHVAKKFQRAVEQSPATIIITDTEAKIEYVNQKFCDLTGYKPHEVLGRSPRFLQSGDLPRKTYVGLRESLARGEEWRGTFRNLKKNGDPYFAKTAILPLRDDEKRITHFIGLGEDITERRKAREQMHRAQKMEAVGLLASGVAHDFNNILTTILGNVHLAQLDAPNDGDFAEELEQIEIAAKRGRNLADQVLTFARRRPGEPLSLPVVEAMREVARLMRASILPSIEIDCQVEDEQLLVLADPTRLHQVMMNLCSNAAEAIGTTGGRITLSCGRYNNSGGKDPLVRFAVSDDGPGIPEEICQKIFDPFFTTKSAGKGTGLGLSVVANLVAEMHGRVSVASKPGEGATFEILLPEAEDAPTAKPTAEPGLSVDGGLCVLLIDDEPHVLATCAKLLRRMNYDVEAFGDPVTAVEAFAKDPDRFALVMTDFVMPNLTGQDVCDAVRELRPDCPIIVYSAYQPESLSLARMEGVRFLEKPINPVHLSRVLHNLVAVPRQDQNNTS